MYNYFLDVVSLKTTLLKFCIFIQLICMTCKLKRVHIR